LLLQKDGSLLLSVADYGLGKVKPALAQLPAGDYGKVIRIAPDGARTLLTMGHRNPSGLAADADGNVWSVEHGPKGGDEVNLLQPGANYGWPLNTYGTDYGAFSWPIAMPADSSTRFTSPAFVLVPSVGISSLIVIRGTEFRSWAGDLLAGSLRGNKLIRFKREGRRLVYAEPIEINRRIRDLVETYDGHIVLYTDRQDLVLLSVEPDVPDLSVVFGQCWQCHTLPNEEPPAHPNLVGIVGREVASDSAYSYSEALQSVGGIWTEERLDAFLASPSRFAPGTTMSFAGIADGVERRAVIALLKREFARK
jgi:cytochrome c2